MYLVMIVINLYEYHIDSFYLYNQFLNHIPTITGRIEDTNPCILDGISNSFNDSNEATSITINDQYQPSKNNLFVCNNNTVQSIDIHKNSLENCASVLISNNPCLLYITIHDQCLSKTDEIDLKCLIMNHNFTNSFSKA